MSQSETNRSAPRFLPLTVTAIRKTIRDAVEVTLAPENPEDFAFVQGQYLTFRRDFDGQELRRNYSICSGLDDGLLQVGIKQVKGGAFSTFANEVLKVGDVLEAMPPMGRFHAPLDAEAARHYLGVAGGSGITPVLSILRTVLAREPQSRFTLLYANRGMNSIMFREELEDLKNRHMERLRIVHVLEEDAQEAELFTGRLTEEKCDALFTAVIPASSLDLAFICGPEPMMNTVSARLAAHGMGKDAIHYELFSAQQPGQLPRPTFAEEDADVQIELTVKLDGTSRKIAMEPGQSVLEAALAAGLDAPYSCSAGVCSTCRCKLVEGEVEMAANHALEDYEVERGFRLSCQSYPMSRTLTVDYDH